MRGASGDEEIHLGVRVQSAFGYSAEKAQLSDLTIFISPSDSEMEAHRSAETSKPKRCIITQKTTTLQTALTTPVGFQPDRPDRVRTPAVTCLLASTL